MFRKLIYSLITATAAFCLLATVGFAADRSSKTGATQESMGKGVGAMQGEERPARRAPEPATGAMERREGTTGEAARSAEESMGKGVGAMQGEERPARRVPAPANPR